MLDPAGILTIPGTASLQFAATAGSNYAVSQWYLDGAAVQGGGSTLTSSNIVTEHTAVSFAASNDLAVTLADLPSIPGPTLTSGTNVYEINIQNRGLNPLSSIIMTDQLPGTAGFISATTSQGIINNSGPIVSAEIGSLAPGASAIVDITFTPLAAGSITDTVSVACAQFEPDLSNNTATDVATVIDPVTITNQPASQTVRVGRRAVFTVGVSGTPPFSYQWLFNSNSIAGATDPTLVLSNVSAAQAGAYSVAVSQTVGGAEGSVQAKSDVAVLTVSP